MSNYNSLKATINANIKTNGNEEITGAILNSVLTSMVNTLGAGYKYGGIATASTNPGSPDTPVFYLAVTAGTYTHMGNFTVAENEIAILRWDTAWHKDETNAASATQMAEVVDILFGTGNVNIDVSSITSCGSRIGLDGKWETNAVNQYYGGLVNVSQYRGRLCKVVSSGGGSYAFVKSGVSLGDNVDFATGWSAYKALGSAGEESLDVVPDDAVYLYVYLQSAGTSYRPQRITILATDSLVTEVDQLREDVSQIQAIIGQVGNIPMPIDVSSINSCGSRIGSDGKWETNAVNQYYGGLVNVSKYRGMAYKIVSSGGGSYAFVKSGVSLGNNADFATGWSAYVAMGASGTEYTGDIPADAVYLYVYLQSAGTSYRPSSIVIYETAEVAYKELTERIDRLDGGSLTLFQYNIGHFSLGVSPNSTITASQYKSKVDGFRALLSTKKPHIYGIEEYSAIFGKNSASQDVNTKDELFNFQDIEYESTQMNYACYAMFANNVPVYNIAINDFECLEDEEITHTNLVTAQDYRYISADVYAFGVTIKLVITHLAFDNNRPGVLTTAQISELISKYATSPYVVMLGDWNVASFSEFDAFTNAGYTMANDGSLLTFPSTGKALDNIVAKGLKISDVQMVVSPLSDHYPLICKVQK